MEDNDSFEVVKEWLSKGGDPRKREVGSIRSALQDIHRRWRRVLSIDPHVTMSERMQMLMRRAGCLVRNGRPYTE